MLVAWPSTFIQYQTRITQQVDHSLILCVSSSISMVGATLYVLVKVPFLFVTFHHIPLVNLLLHPLTVSMSKSKLCIIKSLLKLRCVQIFYIAFLHYRIIKVLYGCICILELNESAAELDTDMTYDNFYVPSEDTSDTSSNESDIE